MSDNETIPADRRVGGRPHREHARKRIPLPNGDELWPRADFAAEIDVVDRTVQRMNLPTVMIGGAAYHPYQELMSTIASRIRRPGQPSATKRRRR